MKDTRKKNLEVGNLAMNYFSTIKLLLLALTFCTILNSSVFPILNWGENMLFYTKKFDEKETIFHTNTRK
jgi:hypothetical protein